jgi:hypothetical protein
VLSELLEQAWRERRQWAPIDVKPRLSNQGLLLGAGTLLATEADESVGQEPRITVLLTIAHLKTPSASTLAHLRKAARRWRDGDEALARMHLALSGLGSLRQPEADARRLLLAETLMDAGVAGGDLLKLLGEEPAAHALGKYSPDQPRVPAGSGRPSGQWTTPGAGGSGQRASSNPQARARSRTSSHPSRRRDEIAKPRPGARAVSPATPTTPTKSQPSSRGARPAAIGAGMAATATAPGEIGATGGGLLDLGTLSGGALARVAAFVGALAPASAVGAVAAGVGGFGLSLIPMDIPTGRWKRIAGPGNISVFQSPTVPGVGFRYTTADGVREDITVAPGPGGEFRDPKTGRVFARLVRTGAALQLLISTATLLRSNGPQLCTNPKEENHGLRGREYEDYVKAYFNRGNPTPSGVGYAFQKLRNENSVTFDDCQKRTGDLAEYKGPGFEKSLIRNDAAWWGQESKMILQAEDQVEADGLAGNRPIYWFFAERSVADHMAGIFQHISPLIHVVWFPMKGAK